MPEPSLWRSSGPNHVFEIFVPGNNSQTLFSGFSDLTKTPVFKLPPRPVRPTTTTKKPITNFVLNLEEFPKKKAKKENQKKFNTRLHKVRRTKVNNQKKVNSFRGGQRRFNKKTTTVKSKNLCKSLTLEECVDSCTTIEDIYNYSGCVVKCSEDCK